MRSEERREEKGYSKTWETGTEKDKINKIHDCVLEQD